MLSDLRINAHPVAIGWPDCRQRVNCWVSYFHGEFALIPQKSNGHFCSVNGYTSASQVCSHDRVENGRNWITGASHASHLGCPMAYSSRVSYIKKRQVWKSRSETDWPHLGIMPGFFTEENRSILILTSTRPHVDKKFLFQTPLNWLLSLHSSKRSAALKRRVLPVFENSRGSIVCLRAANLMMCHDWAVLFLHTSPFQCDSQQTYVKTKPPNHGASQDLLQRQTMEPLEFSKTGKKRHLKGQMFCFCAVTAVSSTVFEREISCQHVDVKMRMLRLPSVEKPGIIPRWGQSVSDRDFHTCLFFMYDTLLL